MITVSETLETKDEELARVKELENSEKEVNILKRS